MKLIKMLNMFYAFAHRLICLGECSGIDQSRLNPPPGGVVILSSSLQSDHSSKSFPPALRSVTGTPGPKGVAGQKLNGLVHNGVMVIIV